MCRFVKEKCLNFITMLLAILEIFFSELLGDVVEGHRERPSGFEKIVEYANSERNNYATLQLCTAMRCLYALLFLLSSYVFFFAFLTSLLLSFWVLFFTIMRQSCKLLLLNCHLTSPACARGININTNRNGVFIYQNKWSM